MANDTTPAPPAAPASPVPTSPTQQPAPRPPYPWILVAVVSPIAMLLPPRKRDLRFTGLLACFSLSTDQIVLHYTGQGIWARTWGRLAPPTDIPAKAEETRRRLEAERLAHMTEEQRQAYAAEKAKQRSWWWSAPEGQDWSSKRAEKDTERMQRGESVIGGYIKDALGQSGEGGGAEGQNKGTK